MEIADIEYLKCCNCLINLGGEIWLPARRSGKEFFTPSGLRVVTPNKWRSASLVEIEAYFDSENSVPIKVI